MSSYAALTLARHVIIMADNMRRLLGRMGDSPFAKPIPVEDARKLFRVSSFVWVTGTGLSGFHNTMAQQMKRIYAINDLHDRLSLTTLLDFRSVRRSLQSTCQAIIEEARETERLIGGSPVDLRHNSFDLLLAALAQEDVPVLVRFSSTNDFFPETHVGQGQLVLSKLSAGDAQDLDREVRWHLGVALDRLIRLEAECFSECVRDKAWDLLPPVMAMISRARPKEVSGSGDLVIINPKGSLWNLF